MISEHSLSLYLHIPFCRHRCSYCDFNTYTSVGDLKEQYSYALIREVEQVGAGAGLAAHTVYFGGGTPSLMAAESLEKIITVVGRQFTLHKAAELSLEANPDTVDLEYLSVLRALGFNRLSFGAQSANDRELALLEREHDFDVVIRAVSQSRRAGFDNINLDLIYGLPGQTMKSWQKTLAAAANLEPQHLSLYCLTIEPGTPMSRWLRNGSIAAPDPDLAADLFDYARDFLAARDYAHYEISNWAKPGYECKHNVTYWLNREYLGLGAGAHGHAAGYRYSVVKQPRVYIRRMSSNYEHTYPWSSAVADRYRLEKRQAMSDTVIMQLRLLKTGLDLQSFETRFALSLRNAFPGVVAPLIDGGLLIEREGKLLLSEKGQFLSNQVFYRFI